MLFLLSAYLYKFHLKTRVDKMALSLKEFVFFISLKVFSIKTVPLITPLK